MREQLDKAMKTIQMQQDQRQAESIEHDTKIKGLHYRVRHKESQLRALRSHADSRQGTAIDFLDSGHGNDYEKQKVSVNQTFGDRVSSVPEKICRSYDTTQQLDSFTGQVAMDDEDRLSSYSGQSSGQFNRNAFLRYLET